MSHPIFEALAQSRPADTVLDALTALRAATRDQHAQLDAGLPIARPEASLPDYAAHACALWAWLTALAPELQALTESEPRFQPGTAERLLALQADLSDAAPALQAGAGSRPGAASAATRAHVQQALACAPGEADAVRWGFAYVVEGSQLGGQVMHRQLADRLAPHPLRYLQGRGADTGTYWKSFIALLRSHVATPQATAAACKGAQAAFAGLAQHLHTEAPRT